MRNRSPNKALGTLSKCSHTDKWLWISPARKYSGLRKRSWFKEACLGQAATILGEGRGPTKGEGPCVIPHRGISPFDEFAATATTLAWKEAGS